MINIGITLAGIGLTLLWMIVLYELSQSRKNKRELFYFLIFLPIILSTAYSRSYLLIILAGITLPLILLVTGISALIIFYFSHWAKTVYEVGGDNRIVWFILILLFNPLWILYRVVE